VTQRNLAEVAKGERVRPNQFAEAEEAVEGGGEDGVE
jgi:hypothetical protein